MLNPPVCDWAGIIDERANKPFYGYRDEVDTWSDPSTKKTFVNNPFAAVARWRGAFQNEMAARMLWSVNPTYAACNHSPVARLNGDSTRKVLTIDSAPGRSVRLTAAGSSDPDGDALQYRWYVYPEPSTYRGKVTITGADSAVASLMVPADDQDGIIHVILEVQDHGKGVPLTAYRRAIIRTGNGGVNAGKITTVNDDQIGTGDDQFNYVGNWIYAKGEFRCHQDDTHSSDTPGDSLSVEFKGTQIKLYGKIDTTHGTATVSVDDAAATPVNFYGPCPEGDVLLFTSAILRAGDHRMKVTVTGTGPVVIDRVDVVGGN